MYSYKMYKRYTRFGGDSMNKLGQVHELLEQKARCSCDSFRF